MTTTSAPAELLTRMFSDFSLEMTCKDVPDMRGAQGIIPQGTRVNITFLGNEDMKMRLMAAQAVREAGFTPVSHISARRLGSAETLREFANGLEEAAASENVFIVAGDPSFPEGPFEDSLQLLQAGQLQSYGVRSVSIAGYPDGHPDIREEILWSSLEAKAAELSRQNLEGVIITQFGFDAGSVLDWVAAVRSRGVDLPIRIGVPGPTSVKRLLTYAARFGVASSAGIVKKYGFSLTNLLGTAGPDRFLHAFAGGYDKALHGEIGLHFYTFGGLKATSEWALTFRDKLQA